MTVIAFDGKTLAADSQLTGEYIEKGATKIFKNVGGFALVGFAGEARLWAPSLAWLEGGAVPELCPFLSQENPVSITCITQSGDIFQYQEGQPWPAQCNAPYATGSGGRFAIGALCAGADAIEAATIAARLDPFCGGGIQFMTLDGCNSQR